MKYKVSEYRSSLDRCRFFAAVLFIHFAQNTDYIFLKCIKNVQGIQTLNSMQTSNVTFPLTVCEPIIASL